MFGKINIKITQLERTCQVLVKEIELLQIQNKILSFRQSFTPTYKIGKTKIGECIEVRYENKKEHDYFGYQNRILVTYLFKGKMKVEEVY